MNKRVDPESRGNLEDELSHIRNVSFAHLVEDDDGQIVNIDIIADTHRAPQRIVRDVEIVLRKHSLDVDRRKIGVVQMERAEALRSPERLEGPGESPVEGPAEVLIAPTPGAGTPAILELVPEMERIRLGAVHSSRRSSGLQVEVELSLGASEGLPGRAEGPVRDGAAEVSLVAEATLNAVRNLLHESYEARLRESRVIEMGEGSLVAVIVEFGRGRSIQLLTGACLQAGSLYDAAVYATLDALNRPLGRATFRATGSGSGQIAGEDPGYDALGA